MSCVAITIGPLSATLKMTTSPAGLWAASGIFSYLAEGICRNIEKYFDDAKIINPIHNNKNGEKYEITKDGIGKYHDRIFFLTDTDPVEIKRIIEEIKKDVFEEIADGLSHAMNLESEKNDIFDFLKDYFSVYYVIDTDAKYDSADGENYIIKLSPYLDALEWTGRYTPTIKKNYLLKFLEGKENNRNKYIKSSFLIPEAKETFQVLNKDKNVRDVEEIANPNKANPQNMKYTAYYAVVKADGDNIGKVLKNVVGGDFGKLKQFSSFCREYLTLASRLIGEYGGLTVFAGGDDLMFIAPVKNCDKNIFSLVSDIRKSFTAALKKSTADGPSLSKLIDEYNSRNKDEEIEHPTLSFGVSIQYKKYPLKEAVQQADELLYIAKDSGRNAIAYALRKNSGQNCQLCYKFDSDYERVLNDFIKSLDNTDADSTEKSLHSVLYHLRAGTMDTQKHENNEYRKSTYELIIEDVLYRKSDQKEMLLEKVFDNLFDSSVQKQAGKFLGYIRTALLNEITYSDVIQMIWTAKFFVEKKREG